MCPITEKLKNTKFFSHFLFMGPVWCSVWFLAAFRRTDVVVLKYNIHDTLAYGCLSTKIDIFPNRLVFLFFFFFKLSERPCEMN